jgi:hypothetical protein
MTTAELLALPDAQIIKMLLAHWQLQSFDKVEFTGFYRPNPKGTTGTLEDLCLVAPTDQPEPFPYSLPFGYEFRPVFHTTPVDTNGEPMQAGQAYRFAVRLSKPTKTPRTDPFALVSKNVRPCVVPEHQRRVDELLSIGTSGPKSNQRKLANALEQMGGSMYLEPNRFLFELLQNADDYPDPKYGNEVRVNFRLLTDYILFQHNGLPFLYRNVESLADVGNSTKTNERETTGYKGIGFKSVFGVSKWVYVRSNNYTFRFSAEGSASEPWHTWPRWTPSLPPVLTADPQFADERRYAVSFALRIDPAKVSGSTGYAAVLQKLLAQPQFALFLRHLSELAIEGVGLTATRLRRTLDRDTGHTVFQVGDQKEEYSVTSYRVDARSKLEELAKLGITAEKSFPEKLRDAHTVNVWFAARFHGTGNLEALPADEAPLFSYLPTNDTTYGLPLLVNADFILAPNRVQVMPDHLWNAFLFHQIGFNLIQWIADQVQRDVARAQTIYQFIPAAQNTNPNQEALNEGILAGVAAIACLPSATTDVPVLVSEAVLDKPGLYQLLPDLYRGLLNDGLAVIQSTAKDSVQGADMIARFGLQFIDWAKFRQVFSHADIANYYQPADAARLLKHFASDDTVVATEWRSIPWLFDQHGKLVAPNESNLYGTLQEAWDPHFPLADEVHYLHPELQLVLKSSPTTAAWVAEELRVAPYNRQAIVRGQLIAAASKLPAEVDGTELAIQYLYHLYRRQELQKWLPTTDADYKKLAKLIVRCGDNNHRPLDSCYLSRHYQPPLELEEIAEEIGKTQFPLVSESYLQLYDEPQTWREFWKFCGVRSPDATGLLKTTLLPAGVQVAAWSVAKHESVVRLAIDAFTKDPTFPRTELGKLKARTITGTAAIADCVLPLAHNPHLALLAKLPIGQVPANTLVTDYFVITNSAAVANFFEAGGCKPWEETKTLSYACEQLVEAALDLPASVAAVRQLYAWHQEKKLTAQTAILRALPLHQQDGSTRPAVETYFSSRYGPEHDVEQLSGGQQKQLLHESYLPTDIAEPEMESWRAFFADLGVVGKFQISVYRPLSRGEVKQRFSNYLEWADNNPSICPYPYNAPKWHYQHTLQNFIGINNLELVTTEAVAGFIAARITKNAEWLLAKAAPVYHTTHGNISWPAGSVLNLFSVVPCTGVPSLRPAHQVYSKLLPAVPPGAPVATVTYGSRELEQRLGLLTTLTSEDALKILIQALPADAVAGTNITSTARNKFTAILYELQDDLIGLRKPIPDWSQQLLLPAADNTWVPVDKAYFIASDEYINSGSGLVLRRLPMLKQDLFQQFCVTLGAKLVDSKDFVDEDTPVQTADFSADFRARVARCKVLELIAHISGEPPEQVTSWSQKLSALRFLQVPSLRRKSLTIPNYTVPTADNNSFADGTFLFVGSLFRGHWARLATFLIKELQLPRSIRPFLIANLLESRELAEQEEVLRAQGCEVPDWLLPPVAPKALVNDSTLPVATLAVATAPAAEPTKISVGSSSFDEPETTVPNSESDEFVSDSSLSPEEQKIVHEQACKAALKWLEDHQYILPPHIGEQFSVLSPVTTPDDKTIKVVVRSALKGRLFFHVHEWTELCEPGTLLLLFCRHVGNQPTILPVTNPAEQLVEANSNTYVRVPNSSLNAAALQRLATDTYQHAPDFRYIFLHLPGPGAPSINLAHRRVEEILSVDTSFAI